MMARHACTGMRLVTHTHVRMLSAELGADYLQRFLPASAVLSSVKGFILCRKCMEIEQNCQPHTQLCLGSHYSVRLQGDMVG